MSNESTQDQPTHEVKEGIAYATIGDAITRNYVVLGGRRVYVFAQVGEELTKEEAHERSTPPSVDAEK